LQIVGESLCEAVDLRAGQSVLDVAAGNGNAALAAARRWARVTASDYVPGLLDQARARAIANGMKIDFQEADAENLPFADSSFDVVLSTFGVMFTPDQEKAGSELLRVCKAGGKIGLANWTPASFIGQLFRIIGTHIPPAEGAKSPAIWGTERRLHELFGAAALVEATPRHFVFRYRSASHWLEASARDASGYPRRKNSFDRVGPAAAENTAKKQPRLCRCRPPSTTYESTNNA
jgi:ubiquinone/menaquinone biosynthesis C-methylase UbiE